MIRLQMNSEDLHADVICHGHALGCRKLGSAENTEFNIHVDFCSPAQNGAGIL